MNIQKLSEMELELFDGEGSGQASGGESAGGASRADAAPGPGQKLPGGKKGRGAGEYENVRYGKSARETPRDAAAEQSMQQRRKAFRDMVTGDYKDIYTEETQRLINSRFKETRALEEQVRRQQPLMELLSARYAVPAGDVDKLTQAIREETKRSERFGREAAREQWVKRQARAWMDQCRAMGEKYPDFDLGKEIKRPEFMAMLRSGTPVEHAYKALHFDELVGSAVKKTAAGTEKRVADHIRARGRRPAENGIAAQSGFITKDDPSKFSREDFEEIARRVARGETIRF